MPRKSKQTETYQLQKARRDNWISHFEKRQLAQVLPDVMIDRYKTACSLLPRPAQLNVWGVDDYTWAELGQVAEIAVRYGLESRLLLPWYWSDKAWADLQEQWNLLPELVHIPCVQPATCTQQDGNRVMRVGMYTAPG